MSEKLAKLTIYVSASLISRIEKEANEPMMLVALADGTVLPLVESIEVGGKTLEDLEKEAKKP